jgi:hypothetical protein
MSKQFKFTTIPEVHEGSLFLLDQTGKNYTMYEDVHSIMDLTHNLKMKLEYYKNLIHRKKCNLHNIFSDKDKNIIQNIIENISVPQQTKQFLDGVLKTNKIEYKNQACTYITNCLHTVEFNIFDNRELYEYVTKWMSLTKNSPTINEKIITLTSDEIYLATSNTFNDQFDTQLHLCDAVKLEFADHNPGNLDAVNLWINMYNHMPQICSMSLHNPISTKSTHMWGLYGNNGHGIAVQYKLTDLIAEVASFFRDWGCPFWIDVVKYENNFNPADEIKSCLKYFKEEDVNARIKHLDMMLKKMPFKKTSQWEHEKELRCVTTNLPKIQCNNISFEESCQMIKKINQQKDENY